MILSRMKNTIKLSHMQSNTSIVGSLIEAYFNAKKQGKHLLINKLILFWCRPIDVLLRPAAKYSEIGRSKWKFILS